MDDVRRTFHHQLDDIRDDIVRLAGMVTEGIGKGTEALLDGDLEAAQAIIDGDDELDALSISIEDRCYHLLALQQPMAGDLRTLVADIRLVAEIERSGDLVVNIVKAARRIYGTELPPRLRGMIEQLGEGSQRLFRLAIDAFVERNDGLAAALDDMDDAVDALHADYIQAMLECHSTHGIPLQPAVQLALVGRYYERIADHAVNIGQKVRYMVTGWMPEMTGAARVAQRNNGPSANGTTADGPVLDGRAPVDDRSEGDRG